MTDFYDVLRRDEIAAFTLRKLYSEYGYTQYKMSKFEEYDLYVKNKDFLISDNVITFTDTDGRLLALKPDVTLSIIKNTKDTPDGLIKTQYNENVYRVSGSTSCYKEIMQAGLECMGKVGISEISEIITLASKSLESISENNILEISHLDIAEGLFDKYALTEDARKKILYYLGQKNSDGICAVCNEYNVSEEGTELISSLALIYGPVDAVLERLEGYRVNEKTENAINELSEIARLQKYSECYNKLRIDLSLVGDMKYYNGFALKGFIEGIPTGILSGGQYDKLMKRMGRRARAIGFALYLDVL